MKRLLMLSIAMILFGAASAQNFQTDLNYSSGKQWGVNIYHVFKNGFVLGAGGTYMFATYTGETRGKYQEVANTSLGDDGSKWSNAFRTNYNVTSFSENRGTVQLLLGKKVGKTAVYASSGLAFRTTYWKGSGYDFLPEFTSPNRNFYVYKNISPKAFIGINISHLLNERVGFNVGYNSISKFSAGVTFNLKNSGLFEN